jgi:hypothetical protein
MGHSSDWVDWVVDAQAYEHYSVSGQATESDIGNRDLLWQ